MARPRQPLVVLPPGFEDEFPDASALATECFLNVGLLTGGVQGATERLLQELGLHSLSAFNVLTVVHGAGGPLPPSVIADRMVVSRATVTGLVDSLERRGLVERRGDRRDGRMRVVALTRRGKGVTERLLPELHRFERDLLAALTEGEQRQLLRLVAKLQHHLPSVAPGAVLGIRDTRPPRI